MLALILLLTTTYLAYGDQGNPVVRDKFIPVDLETSYLHLRTNSTAGSRDKVVIRYRDENGMKAGGISIWFTLPMKYMLVKCQKYQTAFNVPADQDKHWVIEKRGYRTVMLCNGQLVLDITASSETCDSDTWADTWATYWGRKVSYIKFPSEGGDIATDFYYVANYETCKNENPTCEAWARRDMCDHKYLVRHCKPACGTCPHEEQRLTCQGINDVMEAHLAENPFLKAPSVVCLEDDPDKFFPRQCVGNVCMCVNDHGKSYEDLHHDISHLYQCPGVEECHGDLLYMNCAFNLASCDDKIANVSCSQGCGCPYAKPYYNTEEHRCQSFSDFCRPTINVVAGMNCNDVAKVAEAYNTVPPVCDDTDETEYAPKQCGFDDVCYCVSATGDIVEEDVGPNYICRLSSSEFE